MQSMQTKNKKCEIKNIKDNIHARAFKRNSKTYYLHFYLFMQLSYEITITLII